MNQILKRWCLHLFIEHIFLKISVTVHFEIKIRDKVCNFSSLHRSPSQTKDQFEVKSSVKS